MNEAGDYTITHNGTPDTKPCSLISIIPDLGMSSCRGRAEAFARSLSSKLRTLGSQTDDESTCPEDVPIMNGSATNTWMASADSNQTVTDLQPLRNDTETYFDFECELESPGSPVDECDYLRLIETASNTPHNSANELSCQCECKDSSHATSECTFSETKESRDILAASEVPDYVNALKLNGDRLTNGQPSESETQTDENERESKENDLLDDNNSSEHLSTKHALSITEPDLPLTGPDDAIKDTNQLCHIIVNPQDELSLQDQILNELQKQSQAVNKVNSPHREEASVNQDNQDITNVSNVVPEKHLEEITSNSLSPSHLITNGHSDEGEEVVNVEVNESLMPAASATESLKPEDIKSFKDETSTKETSDASEQNNTKRAAHSNLDATDDEDDCRPQRVRRCSSLKTGKTPPGTPGRKKIVRFADVLGLDLADVKTFLDEIPHIPKSAYEDLEMMESETPLQLGPKSDKLLMPLFQQPGGLTTFLDQVREKQVSLENAAVTDVINQTITGSVRVRNLDFNKSVHIRYSLDGWRSFADLQANYVPNSCDGFSDTFAFIIFGNTLNIGQRLELAVRFQCKGQQYWDNNYGANYVFQCLPTSNPVVTTNIPIVPSHHSSQMVGLISPTVGDAWCSSFY